MDFKTAYLAGYLADKYDVTAEQSIDRANERIKRSTEDAFASTVKGYTPSRRRIPPFVCTTARQSTRFTPCGF